MYDEIKIIAQRAFTLIELSIVLVIIGLVVGGVLVGREMIRQSEIRSMESDLTRFGSAVNTFLGKYNALPGDMVNATDYFGTDSAGCPSGGGATGTCNGNGNAQIGAFHYGTAPCCGTSAETFRFWQHLAAAGLVAGKFSGIAGPLGTRQIVIGTNIPATRMANGGYNVYYTYGPGGQSDRFPVENGAHYWWVGSTDTLYGPQYENSGGLFTDAEALALDTKLYDGLPATGLILSTYNNCATTNVVATARYDLTIKTRRCALMIKAPF